MAYTQCDLEGTDTWVTLPKHAWPAHRHDIYVDDEPVCPLRLSLYGHPMAGVHWERHCHKKLREAGFTNIPGWECLFVHWDLQVILSVYVDDFKMAGKKERIPKAWELIRKGIKLDKVSKFDHYLGCGQSPTTVTSNEATRRLQNISEHLPTTVSDPGTETTQSKVPIKAIRYDMSGFVAQVVDRYLELTGKDAGSLKKVPTPCIDRPPDPRRGIRDKRRAPDTERQQRRQDSDEGTLLCSTHQIRPPMDNLFISEDGHEVDQSVRQTSAQADLVPLPQPGSVVGSFRGRPGPRADSTLLQRR